MNNYTQPDDEEYVTYWSLLVILLMSSQRSHDNLLEVSKYLSFYYLLQLFSNATTSSYKTLTTNVQRI